MSRSDIDVAVFYHNFNLDSALALYAIHKHHQGQSVSYIPKETSVPLSSIPQCHQAYLLGIVDHDLIEPLCESCERIIIIDHNYSNQDYLNELQERYPHIEVVFDLHDSISVQIWDFLNLHKSAIIQWALDYAEDADSWKWNLPDSKEINAGMRSYLGLINPEQNPQLFNKLDNLEIEKIIEIGRPIWNKTQEGIDKSLQRPKFWIKLGEYKILTVFLPMNKYRNFVGHILAEESLRMNSVPCGAVASNDNSKDRVKISLRSKEGFDAAELAKRYGGGGHMNSACIRMTSREFEALKIVKNKPHRGRN